MPDDPVVEPAVAPAPVEPTAAPASLISGAEEPAPALEADAQAPAPVEPAPLEPVTAEALKLPENADGAAVKEFLEVLNTPDLSRAEMAQKFIDLQASFSEKANVAAAEAAQSLWDSTQNEWMTACRNLPEIGGDNLSSTLSAINRGLKAAGATAETFQALDLTGAGSHPQIVKLMSALTKPFLEAAPVAGDPPKGSFSAAERLYPTMRKES